MRGGGGRISRFRRWARWELGREIDVTPAIRLITVERFVKGGVLLIGGVALLITGERTDLHRLAIDAQQQLNLQPGSAWWTSLLNRLLTHLAALRPSTTVLVAGGAAAYGALELFEGVGLLLRRRWAEYIVVVATAAFIPLELDEVVRHPTLLKMLGTGANIAIVAYLVWRKRLFIERPSEE